MCQSDELTRVIAPSGRRGLHLIVSPYATGRSASCASSRAAFVILCKKAANWDKGHFQEIMHQANMAIQCSIKYNACIAKCEPPPKEECLE